MSARSSRSSGASTFARNGDPPEQYLTVRSPRPIITVFRPSDPSSGYVSVTGGCNRTG
jgi:hypothetical protein